MQLSLDGSDALARCYRCMQVLPVADFALDASKASGRKSLCCECDRVKGREYYAENRELKLAKTREYQRQFNERHPGYQRRYQQFYYWKTRPEGYKRKLVRDYVRALRMDRCSYCGVSGGHLDHIEAHSHGGADDWANLTGACRSCNSAKRAKGLLVFLLDRLEDREEEAREARERSQAFYGTDFEAVFLGGTQ